MKKLFLIIISFQSCSQLLHVTTTENAKKTWQSHKRIAVVPLKILSSDNYKLKRKDLEIEMLNMQKLSFSIFNNLNTVLNTQKGLSNLSVFLMTADSVIQILAKNNFTYSTLPDKNLHTLCTILNVDAVITGDVDFFSPGLSAILSAPAVYPIPTGIEKAVVTLSIYDSKKAVPIWRYRNSNTAREYNEYYKPSNIINVSNEEYLIAFMFDKAIKVLPYIIQSPLKRHY